jgi:hypothetical protein
MRSGKILRLLAPVLLGLGFSLSALADIDPRISELTPTDQQYMGQQRRLIDDLARVELGSQINGNTTHDLNVLQRLLDRGLVQSQQTQELQAMGIILGDLLAAELDMHWVVYEDSIGRSRALRYRQSEEYLFPVTMISRRREVDNRQPVADIYHKAYDIIDAARPALPFR